MRDQKLNTLGYFLFYCLLGWWTWVQNPWIFQMPQILKNRCNFTLRYFYFLFFFSALWLPHWQLLAVIEQTVSPPPPSPPNVNHWIWAISFWSRAGLGGFETLHLTECQLSIDRNAITPQIAENTLPRLKPSFSKMWKCP